MRMRFNVSNALELVQTALPEEKVSWEHIVLTKREREIFQLCLDGLSSRAISERLGIGFSTVKRHRENMLFKNNCATMRELLAASLGKKGMSHV